MRKSGIPVAQIILALFIVLMGSRRLYAQTSVDRFPKALVGSWVARTLVQGEEEEIVMLTLAPDSSATMLMTTAEDNASGKKPGLNILYWWVDYPSWPNRNGRQLCIKSQIPASDGTIPEARCRSYTILGGRPKLRLVFDERTWEWVKVRQQPTATARKREPVRQQKPR